MRGARGPVIRPAVAVRIIPADAGSTLAGKPVEDSQRDHPRGCGEHSLSPSVLSKYLGSSPRMRGALFIDGRCAVGSRIIPADAGSTGR